MVVPRLYVVMRFVCAMRRDVALRHRWLMAQADPTDQWDMLESQCPFIAKSQNVKYQDAVRAREREEARARARAQAREREGEGVLGISGEGGAAEDEVALAAALEASEVAAAIAAVAAFEEPNV